MDIHQSIEERAQNFEWPALESNPQALTEYV